LLGGSVEGDITVGVGGVSASGHGGVSYGVGAELDADAAIGLGKVGVHLDLGLTLGLGLEAGVDVSVNPRKVASSTVDGAKAVGKGIRTIGRRLT
jgi:hypothetical protein